MTCNEILTISDDEISKELPEFRVLKKLFGLDNKIRLIVIVCK